MKKFYVSRDAVAGNPDVVMITGKQPKKDTCAECGGTDGPYVPASGDRLVFGKDGEFCYNGWLKLTGIKLAKGKFKVIAITEAK